ncbi:hypothetical protein GCM10028786_27200 [Flaviaesturariibacter terrae]
MDRRAYRKSKVLATYSGMVSEFEDGYLQLRENGYFTYYEKIWLVLTLKKGTYAGRYSQRGDTLRLDWLGTAPGRVHYFISDRCVADPATGNLWFVDSSSKRLWELRRTAGR